MSEPRHAGVLHEVITDLTDRFTQSSDLETTLAGITGAAVQLIPGVASADVLVIAHTGDYRSLAATSPQAADMDQLRRRHHEGPCFDAALGETVVLSEDLRQERRWPEYSASAGRAGALTALSIGLHTHRLRPPRRAALNLLGHVPDAFDHNDLTVAAMLATHAAVALFSDYKEQQFRTALASRDVIGQAKGMVMERFDVDAARAFDLIKKLSQDSNTRLAEVAAQIVESGPRQ